MRKLQFVEQIYMLLNNVISTPGKKLKPLAAEDDQPGALGAVTGIDFALGPATDVGVEASAQATVPGYDQIAGRLRLPDFQKRMRRSSALRRDMCQKLVQALSVRARIKQPLLRPAQLGGCHHFHGVGDLLRALNADDASFYVS